MDASPSVVSNPYPIGYLIHMIFTPEMTRTDAILVATSSDATGTNVVHTPEESYRDTLAAYLRDRDIRNLAGMSRRTASSLCG